MSKVKADTQAPFMSSDADLANYSDERRAWLRRPYAERKNICHQVAKLEQSKNKSDPHTYGVVYSQLNAGLKTPEDYGIFPNRAS
jgi:hypothetical protein